MLSAAGVRSEAPELDLVWEVFRRFAAEPVDDVDVDSDGDLVLFETFALHGSTSGIHLIRQFSFVDDEGEYEGMAQLTLGVRGARAPSSGDTAPAGVGDAVVRPAVVWGVARPRSGEPAHEGIHPDLRAWEAAVEAQPAFAAALELPLDRLSVSYGPV